MHYICYSLTQKFLGILFTTSSLCQFLYNSILQHLIGDFHTCIPRQVRRSPLRLKGSWCSHSFHSGSGTPLSFEITEIQHMSLHHFKPCLLQGPFSVPFPAPPLPPYRLLSGPFLLWGVTAHIFSSIHFGTYRLCKHIITTALHCLLITFMCLTCAASILYLIYLHHIKQISILDHSLDPMFIYTSVYSTSLFGSLIGVSNLLQSKKLLYLYPLKSVHHIAFLSQFLEAPSFQLFMPKHLGFIFLSHSLSHPSRNHLTSLFKIHPKYHHFYFNCYHFCQAIIISVLLQCYYKIQIGLFDFILQTATRNPFSKQEPGGTLKT